MTLPPLPPSPPAGPPKGRYFSRRNAMAPSPPLPACTNTRASSMNRIFEDCYLMALRERGNARCVTKTLEHRGEPSLAGEFVECFSAFLGLGEHHFVTALHFP